MTLANPAHTGPMTVAGDIGGLVGIQARAQRLRRSRR
jgi:hypothetical protein